MSGKGACSMHLSMHRPIIISPGYAFTPYGAHDVRLLLVNLFSAPCRMYCTPTCTVHPH